MEILELYAGIGGCAVAAAGRLPVIAAIDQDEAAHHTYVHNLDHPAHRWNLVGVRPERLAALGASLWWMSPPCQPFTVRGRGRDVDDARCQSFLTVIDRIEALWPDAIALENVPGFAGSRAHARLRAVLRLGGYQVDEGLRCPSELGVPNRRRRFYLVAHRHAEVRLPPIPDPAVPRRPLSGYLDPEPEGTLYLSDAFLQRYRGALSVVDARDRLAICECFTSAYGRSPVHAGSYLRDDVGVRRFSISETLALLGFPATFRLPNDLSEGKARKLVGNSLSVPVVARILDTIRDMAGSRVAP